jgi:hypothetical protein
MMEGSRSQSVQITQIQIQEAQKLTDPSDPDLDSQHCMWALFSTSLFEKPWTEKGYNKDNKYKIFFLLVHIFYT